MWYRAHGLLVHHSCMGTTLRELRKIYQEASGDTTKSQLHKMSRASSRYDMLSSP